MLLKTSRIIGYAIGMRIVEEPYSWYKRQTAVLKLSSHEDLAAAPAPESMPPTKIWDEAERIYGLSQPQKPT